MTGLGHRLLIGIASVGLLGAAPAGTALAPVPAAIWRAAGLTPLTPVRPPDVGLIDLDGKRATLAEFRGRVVLAYFWATW